VKCKKEGKKGRCGPNSELARLWGPQTLNYAVPRRARNMNQPVVHNRLQNFRHGKKNPELCRVNTIEMALACIRTPQAEVLK
jgi:hypothetical protein